MCSILRKGFCISSNLVLFGFILFCASDLIFAQYPFFFHCPRYPVIKNFTMTKYVGRWYEIEKYFSFSDITGSCTTSDYSDEGNGTMGIVTKVIHKSLVMKTTYGHAELKNLTSGTGKFKVFYKSVLTGEKYPEGYWILDTDYGNYSIVWSCKNSGIINFQSLWFLSRVRDPPKLIRSKVYNRIRALRLFSRGLKHTDQDHCSQAELKFQQN